MNVNLTPELEKIVHAKVQSGHYNNNSEVVREALRLLAERDRIREKHLARIRGVLAESAAEADRGDLIPLDEVIEELRAALRKRKKPGKKAG
jgi:antitoxin ParD1/3/4